MLLIVAPLNCANSEVNGFGDGDGNGVRVGEGDGEPLGDGFGEPEGDGKGVCVGNGVGVATAANVPERTVFVPCLTVKASPATTVGTVCVLFDGRYSAPLRFGEIVICPICVAFKKTARVVPDGTLTDETLTLKVRLLFEPEVLRYSAMPCGVTLLIGEPLKVARKIVVALGSLVEAPDCKSGIAAHKKATTTVPMVSHKFLVCLFSFIEFLCSLSDNLASRFLAVGSNGLITK